MKKLESITFIIAVVIIAALASCVKDLDGGKEKSGDGTALVTLTLSMPSLPPATRVQGTSTENHVEEIDVLLFDASDNFYYRARGTNISATSDASSDEEKKTFTVKLPTGTYRVVVLANALDAISALATSLPISTIATAPFRSRADVLDKIAFSIAGKMGVTRFPMWGDETLTIDGTPVTTPVKLTRAIARVDVSVADVTSPVTGTSVRDKFEISSVYLYNYSRAGSVAPLVDGAGYDLAAPHLPALVDLADSSTPIKVKGPVEYLVPSTGKHAFKQAIYACEAIAGNPVTGAGWETNTCLVVGGTYTDEDDNEIDTYYRIEFINTSNTYLALKRNYLYDVVIQDVNGPGWPMREDAYANKPSNIVVSITAWNEGELNEIEFNGQHYLSVDKSRLAFYKEGYAKSITVTTDYPGGWTVDVTTLPSWLTVTALVPVGNVASGAADQAVTLTLTAAALGESDPSRSGEFYIVAGNLRKEITVTQSNEIEFWIAITDLAGNAINELFFEAGDASPPPVARAFRVSWLPVTIASVDIQEQPGTFQHASGSYDFGANTSVPGTNGVVEFSVRPPYNSSTSARATRVDFSVALPDGQSRMLPLYLRQEAGIATYAFSPDGTILTLFPNFPRDTNLAGLNSTNIPELQDSDIASAVRTLVIEGNSPDLVNKNQIAGIRNARDTWDAYNEETEPHEGLLPYLANVSLPDFTGEVSSSDYDAFASIAWLERLEVPLATAIQGNTFFRCARLITVTAPNVTVVESYTYAWCSSLTSVDLSKVTSVKSAAFFRCSSLPSVDLPLAQTIESGAFYLCEALTTVTAPNVTVVEEDTYAWCLSLISVDLPVAGTIGTGAFFNCPALTTLKLGHDGEIDVPLETADYTLFQNFYETPLTYAKNIDLYLGAYEYDNNADVTNKTWKGYTWKSISRY